MTTRSHLRANKAEALRLLDQQIREKRLAQKAIRSDRSIETVTALDKKKRLSRAKRKAAKKAKTETAKLTRITKTPIQKRPRSAPSDDMKQAFYRSWDWRTLRMEVLKTFGHRCQACGSTPKDTAMDGSPVKIVVDHIKPLSQFWNLRLDRSNLQVLCDECNMGKGAWDQTDYRPAGTVIWGDEWRTSDKVN